MVCGKHLNFEEDVKCADCAKSERKFDKGLALYEYKSIKDSVFAFKNMKRPDYGRFYGRMMAEYLGTAVRGMKPDAIIPIPLDPGKMKDRGYNQSEILAKALAMECGVPVRTDILLKRKIGKAQKKLNREERQNNIKKAFHIDQNDVKLKTVLVVDDVYTTGATIDAAAAALKAKGVDKVYFATLAIGKGF